MSSPLACSLTVGKPVSLALAAWLTLTLRIGRDYEAKANSELGEGPLAENALVERMPLMAGTHDPGTRAETKRYLARCPRGFAVNGSQQNAAPEARASFTSWH
ncbi:MAG: hypothetical protein ABUL62_14595 [Myxococcales bacterium]